MTGRILHRSVVALMLGAALVGIGAAPAATPESASTEGTIVTAYTAPSVRAKLSFRMSGIVSKVLVKEGDIVKEGQLLAQQDDRVERKQWESLELQSKSDAQILAAEKELKVNEVELARLKGMKDKFNVAAESEVQKAELNRDLASIKIEVAKEEKAVKTLEAASKAAIVDQMRMVNKIEGEVEVEKIDTSVGELADYQRPSIIVVKNDPMWVVINLPNEMAAKLKKGDVMDVRYDYSPAGGKPKFDQNDPWQKATVDFLSPTADASAFKRLVRLTMPNPNRMASGYKVAVRLPEKLVTASTK
jgi:multidrug efflux pump subunit AcrA (membrane-fusion protein)